MINTVLQIFFINLNEKILPSFFVTFPVTANDLEFPFLYYFQINYYKKFYYEELDIDSENIEDLIGDHIEDFRNNLISIHPNFENLQKCSELYYNDYIRIILST